MDLPVGWSNPKKDIMELIFECLNDPLDLLQCLGVCTSWHLIGSQFIRQHLPKLPPLIFSMDSERIAGSRNIDKGMVFYNNQSTRKHRFSLPPQFHGSCLTGGSHGWLISVQHERPHEIYLINALSHAQIRLPNASRIRWSNRLRIIMSANPSSNPNCTILAIDPDKQHFASCRLEDTSWTRLETIYVEDYSAATFYKGRFYVYTRTEKILQIGVMSSQLPKIATVQTQGLSEDLLEIDWRRNDYMLESCGDLLLVSKYKTEMGRIEFKVHKLDNERNMWIEVKDLGNQALFVGYNNSMPILVPPGGSSFGGSTVCRPNCIYFIDDSVENGATFHARRGVYDMNTREFKGWLPGCAPIWFHTPLSWIRPEV